jgi:hypothetical protein
LIDYRLTVSKKPTLRLWKMEDGKKTLMAKVQNGKAMQLKQVVIPNLTLKHFLSFRDGRDIYHLDEEAAIRLFISMKMITGVRDPKRIDRLVEAAQRMDRGDALSWYSLYLKLGFKAIAAIRVAYL